MDKFATKVELAESITEQFKDEEDQKQIRLLAALDSLPNDFCFPRDMLQNKRALETYLSRRHGGEGKERKINVTALVLGSTILGAFIVATPLNTIAMVISLLA